MTEAKSSGLYKKLPFDRGTGKGVTLPGQNNKKIVGVKHNLPGSIILVHGVNDIGVSYDAVESGLCEGLGGAPMRRPNARNLPHAANGRPR